MSILSNGSYLDRDRGDDLPLRRWLQLGVASAGMGVALIGWSLVGSESAVASADSGVGSSSSAGPGASSPKGGDSGSAAQARSGRAGTATTPRNDNRNRKTAANDGDKPSKVVTAASRSDPLGAFGKFLTGTLKELLNRKTTLNPLQNLDNLSPERKSLLDLIPKIPVRAQDSTWNREAGAREAERQALYAANNQRAAEIVQKGVRLTARDGSSVYTVDGKVFVYYAVVAIVNGVNGPRQPKLFTLSDRSSQRNKDAHVRDILKLDPAQVRNLQLK